MSEPPEHRDRRLRAEADAEAGVDEIDAEDEDELLRGIFLEEALEHVEQLTEATQVLSRNPDPAETVETADALLRHLHTLKGAAGSVGFEAIGRASHELEELCAEIRSGALAVTPGIIDRIEEEVGGLRALLDGARATPLRSRPAAASDRIPILPSPAEPTERRRLADRRRIERRAGGDRSVRVDVARLEALLEGVGDLVMVRVRVERRLRELEGTRRDLSSVRLALRASMAEADHLLEEASPVGEGANLRLGGISDRLSEVDIELGNVTTHLDRATRALGGEAESLRKATAELDDELRRARLLPLEWAFSRLPPVLRELERTTGHAADLTFSGGEIEADKGLVEQMAEVLLHLLRNSLAHGLEPEAERVRQGKPARGRLDCRAWQEGDFIFLEFSDDGRGIDRGALVRALGRLGRIAPVSDDRKLLETIFEPAVSVREAADGLAGRGVGLDIVKRSVTRMGGEVAVESSPEMGTRFRFEVPQHAAITEAVLFKVGGQVYGLPAANVVRALPFGQEAAARNKDEAPASGDGRVSAAAARVPVLRLQSLLGVEMPPGHRQSGLLIRHGERSFIVTCDKVIGPRTIVARPLGPLLTPLTLYSAVTVSGAGKAQLVFDVAALAEAAQGPSRAFGSSARRTPPRILIADDSRLAREGTARILIASGFQAMTAEDGWDAWEMLGERRFDALITDLEMPRMDGLELITRIRQEPTLKELPIVVMSSRIARAYRGKAIAAGANALLPKGPHKRTLLETVTRLLAAPTNHP
jgi:chemotaxis protein histidine kinase CheA/ActR/RegA family two-component response regulator